MSPPRISLIIPTTGDPKILNPLLRSILRNTVGSYEVIILKQKTEHPKAKRIYRFWQQRYPQWRFLNGTDNMILTARNLGILENYIPVSPQQDIQWFAEMDDDVILPPNWDEDMIRATEGAPDGAIFVPLLTFRSTMYYKDQVAILPQEVWAALYKAKIDELNKFYSKCFSPDKPILKECGLPEYTFIMRPNKPNLNVLPLLWDTAFDVVRNASRANEDLMMRLRKYKHSAWVIQSVMVFHRQLHRDRFHPKLHYAASTLSNYVLQKWPEYEDNLLPKYLLADSEYNKIDNAEKNMPRGLPPEAVPYFEE